MQGLDIVVVAALFFAIVLCIGVTCVFIGAWLGRIFLHAIGGLNHDDIKYDHPSII